MGGFVDHDNTKQRADSGAYGKVIEKIRKDGVCPFCPEHFAVYHKNPTLMDGTHWLLTKNMYPYEGAKHHVLVLHKKHIESFAEVTPEAWTELRTLIAAFLKQENIPGGTFFMRFGETAYTGASVRHLHANLVSPDGENKDRKPIIARIG